MAIGRLIDISSNNHPNGAAIDWGQVAGAGVSAVFIKATDGTGYVNPYYETDMLEAAHAKIDTCAYHFAEMGDPVAEARKFSQIAGAKARMLDFETNTNAQWARTFLQTLGWGRDQCITYGSSSTLKDFYQQLPSMAFPAAYGQFYPGWGVCWQFTSSATIPGIQGLVDESRWYGNEAQYESLFNTPPPGPPPLLVEGENMTSIVIGGQLHVFGVIGTTAWHWWQEIGPPASAWHSEQLPA